MSERQEFTVSGKVVDHSGLDGDRSYTVADGFSGLAKVIGGAGNNWFTGGHRGDWYQGGANRSGADTAKGGAGDDFLAGGKGANLLRGEGWGDILVGNRDDAFFDRMYGDNGDDILVAGRVKAESRTEEGPNGNSVRVGPQPDNPEWWSPALTKGNFMSGGDGFDEFVLHRDSYVHITDFLHEEDRIVISELGGHTLQESIEVVHHPDGYYGDVHFRIILDGNIVLAEINGYRITDGPNFDPDDPAKVQAAIGRIWSALEGMQGEYWFGGTGGDEKTGTAFDDQMWSWGGDDWIDGGAGDDEIWGGHGNDTIRGGAGRDEIFGEHGNDTLWGGDGNDVVGGSQGNDTLYGGDGEDTLLGDGGNDRLDGGAGVDRLYGGGGRDIFVIDPSGDAPDIIGDFNVAKDYVRLPLGMAQADVRFVAVPEYVETSYGRTITLPAQKLVTGTGDSEKTLAVFLNKDGQDFSNVEFIWDFDPNKEYPPPPSGETIDGTAKKDLLLGTRGDDTINGKAGKDDLYGRDGDDTLNGGEGHDKLYGENGDDTLNGGAGKDILEGGKGDDFLYGNEGDDVLRGGSGNDTLKGDDGDDRLFGGAGNDGMTGGNGHDRLYGGSGDDTLDGDNGADRLEGGEGNDILVGGRHDDRLIGDGGNDRLQGGKDADYLTGGEGADEFLFRKGDGVDVITDFEDGFDTIVFLAEKENKLGSKFIGFGDLVIEETDYGVRITSEKLANGQEILLQGVTADQIDAEDFNFVTIQDYNDLFIA